MNFENFNDFKINLMIGSTLTLPNALNLCHGAWKEIS